MTCRLGIVLFAGASTAIRQVNSMKQRAPHHTDIQPPNLPKQTYAEGLPDDRLLDQAAYAQRAVSSCDLTDQAAEDVTFEQVQFRSVNFGRTRLARPRFLDVRFEACDLSGVGWDKARLRRVEFIGCRLIGAKLLDGIFNDVLFKECNAELSVLWAAGFKAARFEQCVLREVSFEGADLSGVAFDRCDLSKANLRATKLIGADLRHSAIGGVQVGLEELRGAMIDPVQAVHIAGLLGLVVKRDDEEENE